MSDGSGESRDDGTADADSDGADDPFAKLDGDSVAVDDDPFAELDDVELEDDSFGERGATNDELFDEVEVEEVDEESVWQELTGASGTDVAVGGNVPDVETAVDEQIIPKRGYCEKCEYFSDPPETSCGHPGTEIRELVDMKHFRVANCPVVAQRRGLVQPGPESDDD